MLARDYLWRIYWQLAGVIMLTVVVALAGLSFFAHRVIERELAPETAEKAETVGSSVRALVLRATRSGIAFESLHGVDRTLDEVLAANPEFASVAMTNDAGKVLFGRGAINEELREYYQRPEVLAILHVAERKRGAVSVGGQYVVTQPVGAPGRAQGALHIGIDAAFVNRVLLEMLLDVVVVLVVSLFVTLELINFMAGTRLSAGIRELTRQVERMRRGDFTARSRMRVNDEIGRLLQWIDAAVDNVNVRYEFLSGELRDKLSVADAARREALRPAAEALQALAARLRFGSPDPAEAEEETDLDRIRGPLFAFILAEELTRTYLPGYVNELLVTIPGISPQVVIGLPIMLFMLIVALGQPYLGGWSERVGRRTAMLVGAALATVGFVATAFAFNLYDLLLWRSLCALGYGMVFVAAQGYVLERTGKANRAQGFAMFIGAIMVATVCGPSIGGILADNIGYRASFAVSAVVAFLSLLAIMRMPRASPSVKISPTVRAPRPREFLALLASRRFLTLTALAAMPAKILLTGVCFYLVPLYIVSIGDSQAMAGRLLMVYAIMMVLVVPFAASMSDARHHRESYVWLGLIISGLGGTLLIFSESFLTLFSVVVLMGLGQALSIAAQSALVAERCQDEIARFGADAVYGAYRFLERLGNALGPLVASLLVVLHGYRGAFVSISAFVLVCGLAYALTTRLDPLPEPAGERGPG